MEKYNDIKVDHNVQMYTSEMKYKRENILMGRKYIDYISEYSNGFDSFLEMGIGFGKTIGPLSMEYSKLTVIDAEKVLIEKYQDVYQDVEFVHSYFENYHNKNSFDNIGMGFVLDLVEDPVSLLVKYSGMLTKNGRIFVSIENAGSLHRLIAYNAGLIADIKEMSSYNNAFNHKFYNTYENWMGLFADAELKVVDALGLLLKPFSTNQLESLDLDESVYNALSDTAKKLPQISNACFFILER